MFGIAIKFASLVVINIRSIILLKASLPPTFFAGKHCNAVPPIPVHPAPRNMVFGFDVSGLLVFAVKVLAFLQS
jgi:hypothetical protein